MGPDRACWDLITLLPFTSVCDRLIRHVAACGVFCVCSFNVCILLLPFADIHDRLMATVPDPPIPLLVLAGGQCSVPNIAIYYNVFRC